MIVPVRIKPLILISKKSSPKCKQCKYFDTKTNECKLFATNENVYYNAKYIRKNEELCGSDGKYFIYLFLKTK